MKNIGLTIINFMYLKFVIKLNLWLNIKIIYLIQNKITIKINIEAIKQLKNITERLPLNNVRKYFPKIAQVEIDKKAKSKVLKITTSVSLKKNSPILTNCETTIVAVTTPLGLIN